MLSNRGRRSGATVREGFEPSVLPDQALLNVQWKGKCSETELQRAVRREEKHTNQIV